MNTPGALLPGLKGQVEIVVGEEHTAPHVGSGRVHVLATPVGMRVRATAELTKVEKNRLTFSVHAEDAHERIGAGIHERIIINLARFDERMQEKMRLIPRSA